MSLVTPEQLANIIATCERITEPKSPEEWRELALKVHQQHIRWWRDLKTGEVVERDVNDLRNLIVSELSEAFEAWRKGDRMDDHLPHRRGVDVELADAMIRCLDWAGSRPKCLDGFPSSYEIERVGLYCNYAGTSGAIFSMTRAVSESWDPEFICLVINEAAARMCPGVDLWGALSEKLAYNAVRADHTNEARLAEGGKKL